MILLPFVYRQLKIVKSHIVHVPSLSLSETLIFFQTVHLRQTFHDIKGLGYIRRCPVVTLNSDLNVTFVLLYFQQESCAIAKMTARCALYK